MIEMQKEAAEAATVSSSASGETFSSVRWGSRPTQRREFMERERALIRLKNDIWEGGGVRVGGGWGRGRGTRLREGVRRGFRLGKGEIGRDLGSAERRSGRYCMNMGIGASARTLIAYS